MVSGLRVEGLQGLRIAVLSQLGSSVRFFPFGHCVGFRVPGGGVACAVH